MTDKKKQTAEEKSAATESGSVPVDPFVICTVHDAFAYTGAYKVRTPFGDTRQALLLTSSSCTPIGATEATQILPGDEVLGFFPEGFSYGFIIKALPPLANDPRNQVPDSWVLRSRAGAPEDKTHQTPYENEDNRLVNASISRPADTLPGDWGQINELGVALFLGKLMTTMRASDLAKIEAFWGDDLLRIFGWNTQQWTAATERFAFDDEGEYSEILRGTPFMWESMGSYATGEEIFEKNEGDDGGLTRGSEKAYYEPKEKKQVMVFRSQHLRGYLGDVSREQIVITPPEAEGVAKQDDPQDFRGLLEIHKMLDGTYAVRSAKQIILEKSLMLPVPWQKRDPDDPKGDHAADPEPNYKAANFYGSGGDPQEKKPYEWSDTENPMTRNNELWDQEEYLFGKFGLQAADAHKEDWQTAEASAIKFSASDEDNVIDEALYKPKMDFKPFKKLPKYADVTIDKREGHAVRYYKTRSSFHMLDDGSIVLEDGYGSQIVMSGGNIEITCQGDVFTRPGRSAITWAPRDIISRAGWCNEITASKKDVRIKGENNVHVYAGDGDKGNILLECRSKADPAASEWDGKQGTDIESKGIILKCKDAAIDIWSDWRVFAGASKEADGIVEISSGLGRTTIAGKQIGNEATERYGVLVGNDRSSTATPSQFAMDTSSAIMVVSVFDINGAVGVWNGSKGGGLLETQFGVHTKGNVMADGSMSCQGAMSANGMSSTSIHNGTGGGSGPGVSPRGSFVDAEANTTKRTLYAEFDNVTLDDSTSGQGNADVHKAVGFSFRNKDQYKIDDDFRVIEARWQQMYRAFSVNTEKWEEPEVNAAESSTKTRPHPGQEGWETESLYKYADPSASKNVDFTTGQAKDRDKQEQEAPTLEDKKLKDEYVINIQTS